jgi:glutamate-1-semialdehyde 2,1-aminomutase
MKYLVIVQARTNSLRLPNKVMKKIMKKTIIEILLYRLSYSQLIDKIVIATTRNKEDTKLVKLVKDLGYEVYRGSEKNVLKRFFDVSKIYKAKSIIRITGDCPLIEPKIVDRVIKLFEKNQVDYCSNINPRTFPKGLDVEVFTQKALEYSLKKAKKINDFEHVTTIMQKSKKIKKANLFSKKKLSNIRVTLDEKIDFQVIKSVINYFKNNLIFSYGELCKLIKNEPKLFRLNSHLNKN